MPEPAPWWRRWRRTMRRATSRPSSARSPSPALELRAASRGAAPGARGPPRTSGRPRCRGPSSSSRTARGCAATSASVEARAGRRSRPPRRRAGRRCRRCSSGPRPDSPRRAQGGDQGVAQDGVAQVADVRRLVGVDVGVLDDDLAGSGPASRPIRGAPSARCGERPPVEVEVEVAGALDRHPSTPAGGGPEPRRSLRRCRAACARASGPGGGRPAKARSPSSRRGGISSDRVVLDREAVGDHPADLGGERALRARAAWAAECTSVEARGRSGAD